MTIKKKLIAILIAIVLLVTGSIVAQNIANVKNGQQAQASKTRYLSYLVADEFRQTSLDLTRLCRSFVATGEQKYWDAYWQVIKWRNGESPRPDNTDPALYPGVKKKQSDIMRELNFSRQEFDLLALANKNSNALVATESQAMESIKSGYVVDGPFQALPGEDVQTFAQRIVFDNAYHSEAAKILAPVTQFFKAQDQRTAQHLQAIEESASSWLLISLCSQIVAALLIALLIVILIYSLFKPLQEATGAMLNIAEGDGDLQKRLKDSGSDELSTLGKGFNSFAANIQTVIVNLRRMIEEISASSNQLTTTAQQTDNAISEQKEEIQKLFVAIEQLVPAIQDVAMLASDGADKANVANRHATSGIGVVEKAVKNINSLETDIENSSSVINKLAKDTNNISTVLDVIGGIADQTNLLALNAAIEAARAGEQGRGFAVVADEVRTLAQRTQNSTTEIREMIEGLQVEANNAVAVMEQSHIKTETCVKDTTDLGDALENISGSVMAITDINHQIASATEEQSATIEEIRRNIDNINQNVETTSAGSKETADNSQYTTELTIKIQALVNQFKTS
ncbi:methyl-accepting chemotaxis protein [Thalassomonas actiniarum]|uniref:Methyl-accepting chemotaxis protein n=1 Tax=Thalassomonas actiniarum TaxID=485447 RepID=A0AAE9YQM2_9GAMM|nr:methyl-accepting chemotaxis protein [Thalassomonas actiniarum]WDD98593.1 methyl-accepting chemotaxis protein [Thalassomonas actiniarum]